MIGRLRLVVVRFGLPVASLLPKNPPLSRLLLIYSRSNGDGWPHLLVNGPQHTVQKGS